MTDEEINALVEERNVLRRDRKYAEADKIKQTLREKAPGIKILDTPFKQGGGSSWFIEVVLPSTVSLVEVSKEVFKVNDPNSEVVVALVEKAKEYCDLCEKHRGHYEGKLRPSDAQGRQWADAAFHFAMGGVYDVALFRGLVNGAIAELKRVGNRKSFRTIDIIQMAEKFAGAGVVDQSLYGAMSALVVEKTPEGSSLPDSLADLQSGHYTLLSDRPLFALFRFAARQSKHGRQRVYDNVDSDDDEDDENDEVQSEHSSDEQDIAQSVQVPSDFDINSLFEDSTLPLVLDLGCGYGVSLLGLSYTYMQNGMPPKFNFLGCDMNGRAMHFANGISHKWNMMKQCCFIVCDIVKGLQLSMKYAGPMHWVSVNFPTPYRQDMIPDMIQKYSLSADHNNSADSKENSTLPAILSCNSQLPSSIGDFMVTTEVYKLIEDLFHSSFISHGHRKSFLYLQSNVEDVAIVMNGMFCDHLRGHQTTTFPMEIISEVDASFADNNNATDRLTNISKKRKLDDSREKHTIAPSKRQLVWKEKGGKSTLSRFVSPTVNCAENSRDQDEKVSIKESSEFWLDESPLPCLAKTETEVMCKYKNKPVFRQLFSFAMKK